MVCRSAGASLCCFRGLGFLAAAFLAVLGLALLLARFLGIVFTARRLAVFFLGAFPRFCFPLRAAARFLLCAMAVPSVIEHLKKV